MAFCSALPSRADSREHLAQLDVAIAPRSSPSTTPPAVPATRSYPAPPAPCTSPSSFSAASFPSPRTSRAVRPPSASAVRPESAQAVPRRFPRADSPSSTVRSAYPRPPPSGPTRGIAPDWPRHASARRRHRPVSRTATRSWRRCGVVRGGEADSNVRHRASMRTLMSDPPTPDTLEVRYCRTRGV